MNQADQNDLVAKAVKGDDKAFFQLYKTKSRLIMYYALKNVGNYHDAEDAAQEVIIKMYKNIRKLKDPKSFNVWMQRIILSVCKNMYRKMDTRKETHMDMMDMENEYIEDNKEFLPYEYAENEELKEKLLNIISDLPKKRRLAITMYYYDGMTYSEIAEVMDSTVSTVSTNILGAKRTIKKELGLEEEYEAKAKVGALPILTAVIQEDAHRLVSDNLIRTMEQSCSTVIKAGSGSAGFIKFLTGTKITGAVILSSIIITGTILGINDVNIKDSLGDMVNNRSTTSQGSMDPKYKAWMDFEGGDCDCGHINPDSAVVNGLDARDQDVAWKITNKGAQETVLKGKGTKAKNIESSLMDGKKDGEYTIMFVYKDKNGKTVEVWRDLEIDRTGKVSDETNET